MSVNPHALSPEFLALPCRRFFDLPYADQSPSQVLDLWLPAEDGEKPFPLIIHIHGGACLFGEKREKPVEPVLRCLALGFAVADVEYRRGHEARFPANVLDAKAAVRYLRANAEKYHLDPQRFAAWGSSAGGWIVSMLGVTAGNPGFEDLTMGAPDESAAVQAVVDWCGPCGNFLLMAPDGAIPEFPNDPIPEGVFLGAELQAVPELCRMAAPCTYASAESAPTLLIHGADDRTVPPNQSRRFYEALIAAGAEAELHIFGGLGHHSGVWNTHEELNRVTVEFLKKTIG